MNRITPLFTVAISLILTSTAQAWEFRCRFFERIGTKSWPLVNNTIDASSGGLRNIRVQFGVFDDADGPAPAGGFIGWNAGAIVVGGAADNSDERRNNGRISPFNFAADGNGMPPMPDGDPFSVLTEIDATLGTQAPVWVCDPIGNVPPMPPPVTRGRNTFVSVYAFSIDPRPGATTYDMTFSGNHIAAPEWRVVGMPIPPDCNCKTPECDHSGSVIYASLTEVPRPFSCTLTVVVPAPGVGPVYMTAMGIALVRRGRRRVAGWAYKASDQETSR